MEVDKQDMVVQIISGFRGSGKTTFLNQCIEQVKGKTAVIQNDFGAQAVDRENAEGRFMKKSVRSVFAVGWHLSLKKRCAGLPWKIARTEFL